MNNQTIIGQKVNGVVERLIRVGAVVRFEENKKGVLFKSDMLENVFEGGNIICYIKKEREDGTYDLTMFQSGYKNYINSDLEIILKKLDLNKGFLALNDDSPPELIKQFFGISKKRFKQAIGALYKMRRIKITNKGIKAIK